ncbi:MAG: hypothetical protein AAFW73_18945, partial [Bacteroidota bacterium]
MLKGNSLRIFLPNLAGSRTWRYCWLLLWCWNAMVVQGEAQATLAWERTYGSQGYETLGGIVPTTDGHYVFGGVTNAGINNDVSQISRGGSDFWLVKFDANDGDVLWDQRYGGNSTEQLSYLISTSDGGYLLGGWSFSDASGEKSQDNVGFPWFNDYWIVKTDADGNFQWDATFGGPEHDQLWAITATADGGYLLGGMSNSSAGGDKSESSRGSWDYWVVKIDGSGNRIWDRTIGGSRDDMCLTLTQLADGNYLLGGLSASPISGEKTAVDYGSNDFWLVKIDPVGNILWDRTYGGSGDDQLRNLLVAADGSLVLGGLSDSPISGSKTQASRGGQDFYVVKTDPNGNVQWDGRYGGVANEDLYRLRENSKGNFALTGYSSSGIGGDKSEGNRGDQDFWMVLIDAAGNKLYDRTYGGAEGEYASEIWVTPERGYLLGGQTFSGATGDKSAPNYDASMFTRDVWIVRMDCDFAIDLGRDTALCWGEHLVLDPAGGDPLACEFSWSDGSSAAVRHLQVLQDTSYAVTVTDVNGCTATDSIYIVAHPLPSFDLGPDLTLCPGDSALLGTGHPGPGYQWSTGAVTAQIYASQAGSYALTLTDAHGCTATDEVLLRFFPVASAQINRSICAGDSLFLAGAYQRLGGSYLDTLVSSRGCDSLLTTHLLVHPLDTTYQQRYTCQLIDTGTVVQHWTNQWSCDSVVITQTDLWPSDTTRLNVPSCDPVAVGMDTVFWNNRFGCDSLVITTTELLPSDTTRLNVLSCDPAAVGMDTVFWSNRFGCDSLVITTTELLASDTTRLNVPSCDPMAVGMDTVFWNNRFGCDSLVITTTELLASDTTRLNVQSCDPVAVGMDTVFWSNRFGCDSLVITTTELLASDTTRLNVPSC